VKQRLLQSLILISLGWAAANKAWAVSYAWNGSESTNWNTPANWTPNGVPDMGDNVTISSTTRSPQLDDNHSLSTLTLNSGTLNLAGFTLTVNGNTYLSQGNVNNGNLVVTSGEFKTGGSYNSSYWGPVLNGVNLTVTASSLYLFKATITGTTSLTKTGAVNDGYQSPWNIFNGPVSITNTSNTSLTFGGGGYPDVFNGDLSLSNTRSSYICMAYNSLNNQFNGDVIASSTAGGGILFGNLPNSTSQLADGKQIFIGPAGFSSGQLLFRNFRQQDLTPNDLTDNKPSNFSLTGGATLVMQTSYFSGLVSAIVGGFTFTSNTFLSGMNLEKTGTGNHISLGNTYHAPVQMTNSGAGQLRFGNETFQADLILINRGSGDIRPGSSNTTYFNGNVYLNCVAGQGIKWEGGLCRLAEGKQLLIGSLGFSVGDLGLYAITQIGDTPQILELTGSSRLFIGSVYNIRSTFNGPVNFKAPALFLNGSIFNNTARFERTGSWDNTSMWAGGNILNGTTTIINASPQLLMINSNSVNPNDIYNGDVTFSNTGTGLIRFGGGVNIAFNGNVQVNCTNGGGYQFDGGSTMLAAGKTITTGTFTTGRLQLTNFKQMGLTPQTINITGAGQLWMNNCSFEGAVDLTAGAFNLVNNRFVGETILTRTANINNYCNGNTFAKKLKINNRASWPFTLGNPTDDVVK
jgi:hypothetical protein